MIKKILISLVLLFSICSGHAESFSGSDLSLSGSKVNIDSKKIKDRETIVKKLSIGTIERKPFAYKENGEWMGFSIDLWRKVAEENNFEYSFTEYKDFSKMLSETKSYKNDVSVANISITSEREKVFDYSTPIYDSGLNIMGLVENSNIITFYSSFAKKLIIGLEIILIILLIVAHYFFIKNVMEGRLPVYSYFKEIIAISFEIIIQLKDFLGAKLFGLATLLISVFIVAYFSQVLTIHLNQGYADSNIGTKTMSYHNLEEKITGVTNGSTSMHFLENNNIPIKKYSELPDLYSSLEKGEIDYIVHDDPILKYHAKISPSQIFKVCGKVFNHDKYAMLFPQYEDNKNQKLVEQINITLLEMKENGNYDKIYNKYF